MSSEFIYPVPAGTIDVKTLVKELGLPDNRIINVGTPWWSITNDKGETYFIPSQPILQGVSHKSLQDKALSREVTQGGVRYTCVELPVETVKRWLACPELRKDTVNPVSPLGRVCWMGSDGSKRYGSYTDVLHLDNGAVGRAFHLADTSQLGWLPVLQVQVNVPVVELLGVTVQFPAPTDALSLSGELKFSLSLYYKDGSELIHTGSRDDLTRTLKDLAEGKAGPTPLSIQCKVIGNQQNYTSQTSLEDLLKGN